MVIALALLVTAGSCLAEPELAWTSKEVDPLLAWLDVGGRPVADGFDPLPTATSPEGCTARPTGEVLRAPMMALVTAASAGRWVLEAVIYENHEKRHVAIEVYVDTAFTRKEVGSFLSRGEAIGRPSPAGLRAFVDGVPVLDPGSFFAARSHLFDPRRESTLVLIDQESRRLALYERAPDEGPRLVREVRVGFGQQQGQKRVRGDNRTPRGMYFVVDRHRGQFGGPAGPYFGGHWIKINYPNAFDAGHGLERGLIDEKQASAIAASWQARKLTDQSSPLGGGIGLHGWIGPFSDEDPWLSWGCVVLHNEDIRELFDAIPRGAMVVLL